MRTHVALAILIAAAPATDALAFQTAAEVTDAIRDSVASCHPNTPNERFEVVPLHSLEHYALAPGDVALQLVEPTRPCDVGRMTYHVRVQRENRTVLVPVGVEVQRFARGYGAKRDVSRGASIAPGDVELEWFDVTYKPADPIRDEDAFSGMVAKTRIRRGVMFTSDVLELAPMIVSGSKVTVRCSGSGFRILAEGIAREDGRSGERIRVKNLASGRILRAVVVAPGVVEL